MNSTQPTSNRNFILGFAILAAISLTYGLLNFHKALPEVGIDFKISRKEALQNARTYLESRHIDLNGFRETISFSSNGGDKLYIEKELGVARLSSLSEDTLNIWRWRARFFKALQKLEYRVYIDPKGRIVGFEREIDESANGLSLDTLAAQILGEAFLSGPTGIVLEKWELVETTTIDRPKRRDYSFTYELKDFKVKEATYRLTVELQGAEVSRYYFSLREPEDWWRDWDKQRAQNELFGNLATGAMMLTLIGIFYYFFIHVKKGRIPWKTGIMLSIVLGVANFLAVLNSIPMQLALVATTTSYGAFITQQIIQSLFQGLFMGLTLILLYGAGEYVYRTDHPTKLSLTGIFSKRGMKSKEFFEATIMGYLLCAFIIGFLTLYYIVGSKFGFWSPADVKYDESVSTFLPWIYPLAISLYAALTEEFWFRMFGISLFQRLTKIKWLAILIPAIIWGFLHSSYPQQPGYARGIELTIVGVFAGIVMFRFGIWASLVYHYVYDAILIGLFLFRSQNLYFWTSGLIVCGFVLIPAAIAGISWLKRRRFEDVDDLLNQAQLDPEPEVQQPLPSSETLSISAETSHLANSHNLSARSRKVAIIIGLAGLTTLLLPSARQFGDNFEWKVDRAEAVNRASQLVSYQYGIDPAEYKIGIETRGQSNTRLSGIRLGLTSRDYTISYLKAHASLEQAEELLLSPNGRPLYAWSVIFKRPLDATEYHVTVPMNGTESSAFKLIADSLAGADLPLDSAKAIAADFIRSTVSNAADYHQVEERSIKRPNRRDWYFTYESVQPVAGEAFLRQSIELLGSEPTISARWIKIPEEWRRAEENKEVGAAIFQGVGVLVLFFAVWLLFKSLGKEMKQGNVNWANARKIGYIATAGSMLLILLTTPSFWMEYDTAKPVSSIFIEWGISAFVMMILVFGFAMLLAALSESLSNSQSGTNRGLMSSLKEIGWNSSDSSILIGLTGGIIGLKTLIDWLILTFGLPTHTWATNLPATIGAYLPWLAATSSTIPSVLIQGTGAVIIFLLISRIIKKPIHHLFAWIAIFLITFGPKFGSMGNWTTGETIWTAIQGGVIIILGYAGLRAWVVGRLHAMLAALLITGLISEGYDLVRLSGSNYVTQGWFLISLSIMLFIWLVYRGFKNERHMSDFANS